MGGTLISNTTACVLSGRPAATCLFFAAFNFTNCVYETGRLMPPDALAPLTPVSRCLNASGCLDMYDVGACVGPSAFNLSIADFNYTTCVALLSATNLTLGGNETVPAAAGCDVLYNASAFERFDNATEGDGEIVLEELPRFHPCAGAFEPDRWRQLDFLHAARPFTSYMVAALSPDMGPVAGGTTTHVCGVGFALTNENVNHMKCRFSDGYNTQVVSAVHVDNRTLRCVTPDFSRYSVGLPHVVSVKVRRGRRP